MATLYAAARRRRHTPPALIRSSYRVQELDERCSRAVQSLDRGIFRVDQIVLVRRVSTGAVAESEITGRKTQGRRGEPIAGPRSWVAWHHQRRGPEFAECREHGLEEFAVRIGLGGIVAATHVDFDIRQYVLRKMGLQLGQRIGARHCR